MQSPIPINLSPGVPRLHAVQLTALIDHYLVERSHHLQSRTIRGYRFKLEHFLKWWQREGPDREWLLSESALADFAAHLRTVLSARGKQLSWHSRNDVLRHLRTVFVWAHGRGYIGVNFAEFVPKARGSAPERLPVELSVVGRLLAACDATNHPMRNRALVATLAGTGIRCEECAALRAEKVTLHADRAGFLELTVTKFDKPRIVACDQITGHYLAEWLDFLPYSVGPLFPSRNRGPLGEPAALIPSGLYKILCTLAEIAGVEEQIHGAHDLRRLFATVWARTLPGQGHLLQKQLGHTSYNTTLRYVLRDPTDIQRAMAGRAVSPLAQLALLKSEG
jgi:integrase